MPKTSQSTSASVPMPSGRGGYQNSGLLGRLVISACVVQVDGIWVVPKNEAGSKCARGLNPRLAPGSHPPFPDESPEHAKRAQSSGGYSLASTSHFQTWKLTTFLF